MRESTKLEISEKNIIFLTLREDGYSSEDQLAPWGPKGHSDSGQYKLLPGELLC